MSRGPAGAKRVSKTGGGNTAGCSKVSGTFGAQGFSLIRTERRVYKTDRT